MTQRWLEPCFPFNTGFKVWRASCCLHGIFSERAIERDLEPAAIAVIIVYIKTVCRLQFLLPKTSRNISVKMSGRPSQGAYPIFAQPLGNALGGN